MGRNRVSRRTGGALAAKESAVPKEGLAAVQAASDADAAKATARDAELQAAIAKRAAMMKQRAADRKAAKAAGAAAPTLPAKPTVDQVAKARAIRARVLANAAKNPASKYVRAAPGERAVFDDAAIPALRSKLGVNRADASTMARAYRSESLHGPTFKKLAHREGVSLPDAASWKTAWKTLSAVSKEVSAHNTKAGFKG